MKPRDNIIKIFAGCFRLLAKLNAGIKDGFFMDVISEESEILLAGYLEFLKMKGDAIARCRHVAQCHSALISEIEKLLNILSILNYLNLTKPIASLLLVRELLKLKLLLLNDNEQPLAIGKRMGGSQKNQQKNKNTNPPVDNLSELNSDRTSDGTKPQELGVVHQRIAEFISGKERVQNIEVFSQFANATRRTLKRKLSELIKAGIIKRLALGKKVFYAASIRVQLR